MKGSVLSACVLQDIAWSLQRTHDSRRTCTPPRLSSQVFPRLGLPASPRRRAPLGEHRQGGGRREFTGPNIHSCGGNTNIDACFTSLPAPSLRLATPSPKRWNVSELRHPPSRSARPHATVRTIKPFPAGGGEESPDVCPPQGLGTLLIIPAPRHTHFTRI